MTPRTQAALLTAAYYGVMFAALGAHLPYWPVWLEHWGLTTAEIGWYLGAATVARIAGSTSSSSRKSSRVRHPIKRST